MTEEEEYIERLEDRLIEVRVDQAARILELEAALASVLELARSPHVAHVYQGVFPCASRPESHAADCPACKILTAAEATLRGETRP
jgi:hypothetical protein